MQYFDWYNGSRPHVRLNKKTPDEAYTVLLPTEEHGKLSETPGKQYSGSRPPIQATAPPASNPAGPILGADLE